MARQKQSEPSLSLDRRQLLASAAALGIGRTVPDAEAAARSPIRRKQPPSRNRRIGDCGFERMRRDRSEN